MKKNNVIIIDGFETMPKGTFRGGEQDGAEELPKGTFRGGGGKEA